LQIRAAAYRCNLESRLAREDSIRVSASSNSGGNTISSIRITINLARTNIEEKSTRTSMIESMRISISMQISIRVSIGIGIA
jgi:hypothetical protein